LFPRNKDFFKGQNSIDFGKESADDVACKRYLSKLKREKGFKCSKYEYSSGCEKSGFNYHCYKCNHVESSTAGTLFHRVRFGLHKAFHIVFEMVNSSKGISSVQCCKRYGIRQSTAWFFMQKVRKAMESNKKTSTGRISSG